MGYILILLLVLIPIQEAFRYQRIAPEPLTREVTAYTARIEETDNEPCISASGMNVCETDLPIVATNELPFGTWIRIDGKRYVVQDRMASRFPKRYDILMDNVGEALAWGIQTKEIEVYE